MISVVDNKVSIDGIVCGEIISESIAGPVYKHTGEQLLNHIALEEIAILLQARCILDRQ